MKCWIKGILSYIFIILGIIGILALMAGGIFGFIWALVKLLEHSNPLVLIRGFGIIIGFIISLVYVLDRMNRYYRWLKIYEDRRYKKCSCLEMVLSEMFSKNIFDYDEFKQINKSSKSRLYWKAFGCFWIELITFSILLCLATYIMFGYFIVDIILGWSIWYCWGLPMSIIGGIGALILLGYGFREAAKAFCKKEKELGKKLSIKEYIEDIIK